MKEKTKKLISKIKDFYEANKTNFIGFIIIALFFFVLTICIELINTSNFTVSDSYIGDLSPYGKIYNMSYVVETAVSHYKMFSNFLMCIWLFIIIYGISNRPRLSAVLTSVIVIFFELLNYFVLQVRGFAITISDIYAVKTAISVAGGLSLKIKADLVLAIILLIFDYIMLFGLFKTGKQEKLKVKLRVLKAVAFVIIGIFGMVSFLNWKTLDEMLIWDINSCYADYGSTLTIAKMLKDYKVNPPDGYVREEIEEYIATFKDDTKDLDEETKKRLPNIVVIMDESFSDLDLVYDINKEEDPIPYFHELMSDPKVASGIMHSSKIGGGTSSVEYEFLTQNTTAFLPVGSIPYQQYIKNNVSESMVERFKRLDYTTHGMHSYYNSGYSRGKVYKLLGFDDIKFMGDMPELELSRNNYPTDSSTFKYAYKTILPEADDKRDFTFVLTMQNHIAYANDETGHMFYPDDYFANIYMQEQSMTDSALRELIDYFSSVEEDTVILFFGDHQPSLNSTEIFSIKDGVSDDEAEFIVPFFIWANYDLDVKKDVEISTNYMQSLLYEVAKIPTDSYTKYIQELRKEIPVITCNYYKGSDGNIYKLNDNESPYFNSINRYNMICYYHLFEE